MLYHVKQKERLVVSFFFVVNVSLQVSFCNVVTTLAEIINIVIIIVIIIVAFLVVALLLLLLSSRDNVLNVGMLDRFLTFGNRSIQMTPYRTR